MSHPFFSIIIVTYNEEQNIAMTIGSVLSQLCNDFEIIVKDAESTDKTLKLIPQDDRIRVYSQKDDGIYFGMNEALSYANGQYILFLNSGDKLHDKMVLCRVKEFAQKRHENAVIYGDWNYNGFLHRQPDELKPFFLFRTPLNHQSVFFPHEYVNNENVYDTRYRICADYELTMRLYSFGVSFEHINVIVSDYLGGGISESKEGCMLKKKEFVSVRKTYFSKKEQLLYGTALRMTFVELRKKIMSEDMPLIIRRLYNHIANVFNT